MKKLTLILVTVVCLLSACEKAGTGGAYTIEVLTYHHDTQISGATVYIKYNAKDFPGEDVSVYDDSKIAVTHPGTDSHVHFEGLKKGNYYLYSIGYDSTISETVKGGIPLVIKEKAGEATVTVYVTE